MLIKRLILLTVVFLFVGMVKAQSTPDPYPTPYPTLQATLPQDMYGFMATAAANVNNLPNEINRNNGANIVTTTNNAAQLFSYGKWLFSDRSARELLGNTFAPLAINLFLILIAVVALTAIWFLINLAVLIIKAIIWVINQVLKFIPFLG